MVILLLLVCFDFLDLVWEGGGGGGGGCCFGCLSLVIFVGGGRSLRIFVR